MSDYRIDTNGIYFNGALKIDATKTYISSDTGDVNVDTSNLVDLSSNQDICGNKVFKETITFDQSIIGDLSGHITGNAGTVTDGVYLTGDQDICGNKVFKETITFDQPIIGDLSGDITGNAGSVTDGVYLSTPQTITGKKTFNHVDINGDISGPTIRTGGSDVRLGNHAGREAYVIGGDYNMTAIGSNALRYVHDGDANTGVGRQALYFLKEGDYNVGIGYLAGWKSIPSSSFTYGNNCTFLGSLTGVDLSDNTYNNSTAIGYGAIIDASNQIVLGTANETVQIPGHISGSYIEIRPETPDNENPLTRFGRLTGGGSSINKTAFGYGALMADNGSYNTAVGRFALKTLESGVCNTGIGEFSGWNDASGIFIRYGNNNTFLGRRTSVANSALTYNNSTAVGAHAIIDASNQIVLGTAGETVKIPGDLNVVGDAACSGSISNWSDDRLKHNETDISNALHTIRQLHPKHYIKTYEMYDADHSFPLDISGQPIDICGNVVRHSIEEGLIAQDLLHIESFKPFVRVPTDETKPYGVNYNSIFVHSIKALQELDAEHTQTKSELASTKETLLQTETILQSVLSRITALEQASGS